MKWPWRHRPPCEPSEDARHAVQQAHRQLADAQALSSGVDELVRRADELGDQWQDMRRRNHVAEAVVESIRRRTQHP